MRADAASTTTAPSQRRFFRLLVGNLVVFVLLMALVCAGGELYYRFVFDSTDSFGLTRVCKRWFERHYVGNNLGVRDNVDYRLERDPARRRLTFLGDSFTAGHGIADVNARFTNRLRSSLGPGWEVHVLAANGIDTGAEVEGLAGLVQGGYGLDTVVLVYVLNDIADLVPTWGAILERIYAGQGREPFWVRHSYFLNVLYYRVKAARDPDISNYYGFVRDAYAGPLWAEQRRRLAGLHDLCRAQGARLLVVTFPLLNMLGAEYPYQAVHEQLGALWEEEGVPHLDLLTRYQAHAEEALVIGLFDAHPNVHAHQLAAEAIREFLEPHLLSPAPP